MPFWKRAEMKMAVLDNCGDVPRKLPFFLFMAVSFCLLFCVWFKFQGFFVPVDLLEDV